MARVDDILRRELDFLVVKLRESMAKSGRNATGKTSGEIKSEVKGGVSIVVGEVTAPEHVVQLEFGRKPTQGEPTGDSSWYNSADFDNWLIARNIPLEAKYPVFKKIHEEGFKGTKGLITNPVDESIDRITKRIADAVSDNFLKKIGK